MIVFNVDGKWVEIFKDEFVILEYVLVSDVLESLDEDEEEEEVSDDEEEDVDVLFFGV